MTRKIAWWGDAFALSARGRGEREGTRRGSDGEGGVGDVATRNGGFPHLTLTPSATEGGEARDGD
jgi:hypothetical protein